MPNEKRSTAMSNALRQLKQISDIIAEQSARLAVIMEKLDVEGEPDPHATCESCGEAIFEGEHHCPTSEGDDLCEACSPTVSDILQQLLNYNEDDIDQHFEGDWNRYDETVAELTATATTNPEKKHGGAWRP